MLPLARLASLSSRFHELEEMLCQPDVLADSKRYTLLSRERGELAALAKAFAEYNETTRRLAEDRAALEDPELRELVLEEIPALEQREAELAAELELLLLPSDPNDQRNTLLEIRSGAGGEEAALFAADLFRMYGRFAERRGWRIEIMSTSEAQAGGLKELIALVSGERVYSQLRFEGGVHRVQRVPATEAQGRIHTSTATVAVLPEADEVDVVIDERDLEINIAASGGPGGQGVNTTNSAVQIQHKPSGIIVKCQDERSQLKNKAKAMKILRARLLERAQDAQAASVSADRSAMVGSGDRAEKIRTYNYPQNRITDHRIGLTLHKLDAVVNGDLDELVNALRTHHQAEALKRQAQENG
jgi:peptide chain release factor 1